MILAAEFVSGDGVQVFHETFQISHLLIELFGAVWTLNFLRRFEVIGSRPVGHAIFMDDRWRRDGRRYDSLLVGAGLGRRINRGWLPVNVTVWWHDLDRRSWLRWRCRHSETLEWMAELRVSLSVGRGQRRRRHRLRRLTGRAHHHTSRRRMNQTGTTIIATLGTISRFWRRSADVDRDVSSSASRRQSRRVNSWPRCRRVNWPGVAMLIETTIGDGCHRGNSCSNQSK